MQIKTYKIYNECGANI